MAGFGVIKGIVHEKDHIVLDAYAHNCLMEGSKAATKNIHRAKHLDNKDMEKIIKEIREKEPETAILAVTEGLFSMDADTTNIEEL